MDKPSFQYFESALGRRNPLLAERLQPGLSEDRVRKLLKRADVQGDIQPVIDLFTWKNGCDLDSGLTKDQATLFPQLYYLFMGLEFLLDHFKMHKTWSKYQPAFVEVAGRYFPLFWNGAVNWIAVDLDASSHNRVVVLDKKADNLVHEAYVSFNAFLKDAIRANENNDRLACFKME